jgi:hypothetical protein
LAFRVALDVEAAYRLLHGLEDERAVLGEQVAVNVLGSFDLAVTHLIGDLHIGGARGYEQACAYVPQFVGGVFDDSVFMGRGVVIRTEANRTVIEGLDTQTMVAAAGESSPQSVADEAATRLRAASDTLREAD